MKIKLPEYLPAMRFKEISAVVVIALVLLGTAARLRQYLAAPSYWYDEAYLLLNIFHKSYASLLGPLTDSQAAPPLYLWCLRFLYAHLGGTEFVMRSPAFAAGVISIALIYIASRMLIDNSGWLWALAFCAISKHAVQHGNEVKPYAIDLMITLILIITTNWHIQSSTPTNQRRTGTCLLMAVFFTPWISFPAVFTLGGVGVSLLWQAILLRKRSKWVFLAVLIVVFIISFLPLWCLVLRHQKTQELHDYWRSYYGDMSSPVALLFWVLRSLVVIGNYGSNGLGIPLVLLAICGAMLLWRKSPLRMLLLVSPVIFAIIGGVLRFYPIADRLVFFLEPCMWLLASNAIGEAMDATWERRAPAWLATAARAAGAFLLIPGTADVVKETAVTTSRMEFREAFVYAREHELPGDIYWVSHPQVFEVYYGGAKQSLGSYIPAADILNLAQGKRLWLIFAIAPSGQHSPATSVEEQLESAGMNLLNERHLHGVSLRLYGPHIISK